MNSPLRPMHALLLAGMVPLFLGVLLSAIAYFRSYEVQWKNFASWLIVGGLFFGGFALLWALVELVHDGWRAGETAIYTALLLTAWVLGFINALVHAGDAWASMPEGLLLSAVVSVLVIAATWLGFFRSRSRGAE